MPGKLHQRLLSLNPLGEVLGENAPAFLQLLVLVPVTLLHAHEPAFILGGGGEHPGGTEMGKEGAWALQGMHLSGDLLRGYAFLCLFISSGLSHPPPKEHLLQVVFPANLPRPKSNFPRSYLPFSRWWI